MGDATYFLRCLSYIAAKNMLLEILEQTKCVVSYYK